MNMSKSDSCKSVRIYNSTIPGARTHYHARNPARFRSVVLRCSLILESGLRIQLDRGLRGDNHYPAEIQPEIGSAIAVHLEQIWPPLLLV